MKAGSRTDHAASQLASLVTAATEAFIANGYRNTRIEDIAASLRWAKGTVYLYVKSKEALFDLVVRQADPETTLPDPSALPVPISDPAATVHFVQERLSSQVQRLRLVAALHSAPAPQPRQETEAILRDLYHTMTRYRVGLKLIDRCSSDYPALGNIWFGHGRAGLMDLLRQYFASRNLFTGNAAETGVAARFVVETLAFWTIHRHWDPAPQKVDPDAAEDAVIRLLLGALCGGAA